LLSEGDSSEISENVKSMKGALAAETWLLVTLTGPSQKCKVQEWFAKVFAYLQKE
jgi:hypothetical protein